MKKILILSGLIFITSTLFSQGKWSAEIRGGRDLVVFDNTFKSWDHSWSIGMGLLYKIHPQIKLSFGAGYHYFKFKSAHLPPEQVPSSLLFDKVKDEDTRMYDFSVGLNMYNSENMSGIYSSLRSGICYFEYGKIYYYLYYFDELRPFFSMSLGYDIKITSRLHLRIEGGMMTAFKGECSFFPAQAGLEYKF